MGINSAEDDKNYVFNSSYSADETNSLLNTKESSPIQSYSTSSLQNTRTFSIQSQRNVSNQTGISSYFAVFLIVNAALGAGLLNFGKAFDEAGGILVSSIIQIILALLIFGSLIVLGFCTDKTQSSNFQDVIYSICGKSCQTINSLCIIIYMFGCCITFFIIIGDQLDQIISCISGPNYAEFWYFNRKFTISITSLILILPLCYAKRIDFLTYPSMFAVIAIVYIVILIPIKYAHSNTKDIIIKKKPDHWMDIFSVLPVICFGYQCHVNVVPIYACLKKKTLNEFIKSILISIIIVFTAYTVSAIYGYLTFGNKIDDDLLKTYDSKDVSVLIAIIMYLIKTYTSYPLNLFCARTAIEGLWIEIFRLNSNAIIRYEKRRRYLIVTIWFILSLLIALYLPNISTVIHYLGALASTFMFVFPGLCLFFIAIERNNYTNKTIIIYIIAFMYIMIGVFIMGLMLTQSIYKDFIKNDN